MAGVFQNNDPPPPSPPCLWCGGRTHWLGGEGGRGVNIFEDARHSSVLYIRKYFVKILLYFYNKILCSFNEKYR
jgi:hypothetical protein